MVRYHVFAWRALVWPTIWPICVATTFTKSRLKGSARKFGVPAPDDGRALQHGKGPPVVGTVAQGV